MRRCSSQRLGGLTCRVGGVAQQVVGEVVAVADLAQDPAAPQLVDRADHGVGVEVGGLGEQVEGEVAADRGGEPGDVAGLRGSPARAGWRSTDASWPLARCDARAGAPGLDDVEREPAGRRVQQHRLGCGQRAR